MSDWFTRYEQELVAAAARMQAAHGRTRARPHWTPPRTRLLTGAAVAVLIAAVIVAVGRVDLHTDEQAITPPRPTTVPAPLQGRWDGAGGALLELLPRGYVLVPARGPEMAGTAELQAGELVVKSTPTSGCGRAGAGRYTARRAGPGQLLVRLLDDPCRARARALAGDWRVSARLGPR